MIAHRLGTTSRLVERALPVLFGSTIGANVLSMALANFVELKTPHISWLFGGAFLLVALLQLSGGITFPCLSKKEILFGTCFGFVLFLPRLGYLLEGWIGYSVNPVCLDDLGHIQELAAIVHSDQFPPISTFDLSKYLSLYYAPWMLGAALYWTGLLLTVKQALAVTILIYHLFFSYFVVYASKALFAEKEMQRAFVILCVLYGGFDFLYWLSGLSPVLTTDIEWWAEAFGFHLQFSNFFTLTLWVPHHCIAVLAILFGLYVIQISQKTTARVLAGMCFACGVFSSVFVAVGSLLLVCWTFIRGRQLNAIPVSLATFVVCCAPLWWIYLGKDGSSGFEIFGALTGVWLDHKGTAFLAFLLVISLELIPIGGSALYSGARHRNRLWLIGPAAMYLLSTFLVAYTGANNYAMRGSIVPILTLTYAATPTIFSWVRSVPRVWVWIAAVSYLSGGLMQYAAFSLTAFRALRGSDTEFNRQVLTSNSIRRGLVEDSLVEEARRHPDGWYLLERPKRRPKVPIEEWNMELVNSDNRYRITLSRILAQLHKIDAGTKHITPSEMSRVE